MHKNVATAIALVMPILGGGTERHFDEMAQAWSSQGASVLTIKIQCRIMHCVILKNGKPWRKFILDTENEARIHELFRLCHVGIIHYHHFWQLSDAVINWPERFQIPFAVTIHDYYTICPYIQLTVNGAYCGEKGDLSCNQCIQNNHFLERSFGANQERAVLSIGEWREFWGDILEKAALIVVPNVDVKYRLLRYYPSLGIKVVENPEVRTFSKVGEGRKPDNTEKIKIGILGIMSKPKGGEIVQQCAKYIETHKLPMELILWGDFLPEIEDAPISIQVKGRYNESEIYTLIQREDINFFWFPALGPETYSYTLSIPIRLKIPVLGTNLGAIAQRIKKNGWGEIYPWTFTTKEIVQYMLSFNYTKWEKQSQNFVVKNNRFPDVETYYNGLVSIVNDMEYSPDKVDQFISQCYLDIKRHCPKYLNGYEMEQLLKNTPDIITCFYIIRNLDRGWAWQYLRRHSFRQIFRRIFH